MSAFAAWRVARRPDPRLAALGPFRVEHDEVVLPEPVEKPAALLSLDLSRALQDLANRALAVDRRNEALLGSVETPFGTVPGLGADLVTVNQLMGADAVEPFVSAARAAGAGVLVLVRTSNPGAADVEDLELARAHVGAAS